MMENKSKQQSLIDAAKILEAAAAHYEEIRASLVAEGVTVFIHANSVVDRATRPKIGT